MKEKWGNIASIKTNEFILVLYMRIALIVGGKRRKNTKIQKLPFRVNFMHILAVYLCLSFINRNRQMQRKIFELHLYTEYVNWMK